MASHQSAVPINSHIDQVVTPTQGYLLPYLPRYEQRTELPILQSGSVNIPTFIRSVIFCLVMYGRSETAEGEFLPELEIERRNPWSKAQYVFH